MALADTIMGSPLWSPLTFALLLALSIGLMWMAFAPSAPARAVRGRLDGYLKRPDLQIEEVTDRPFVARALLPFFRAILRFLGRLLPGRGLERIRTLLIHAGEPGGMSALDFVGLRLLLLLALGGGYLLLFGLGEPFSIALRNTALLAAVGYFGPFFWLRSRARRRQHRIRRALPDALDMMTIGVEAGLAFESAMVRVGEKWDNELTRELRRAVGEMRVGTPRDVALERMAARCGVDELSAFVAILVQSSQLGVTIAQVLHTQADEMRVRRRQQAEELARQAGVKMVFPLVVFILPALFVVILGPGVPRLIEFFNAMTQGTGSLD